MQINLSRFYFMYKTLPPLRHYNIVSELEFTLEMLHVFELEQSSKAQDTLVELGWTEPQLKLHWLHPHPKCKTATQHCCATTHRQWDQPDLGGNFKSSFYLLFPEEVIWKNSNWIQNRGRGNSTGSSLTSVTPSSQPLQLLFNSQTEFQLKWKRPSKGSAREGKLIVFKLVVSNILLQCMEAAFIPSPVSFMMLNDKTAMLSIAWAMNHSVEQLFTQKTHVLLIQQPE